MAESNSNPWSSCPCLWRAWITGVYHYFFSLPGDTRCPAEPGAQSRQKGLNGKLCAICILRHPLRTSSETGATECRSLIRYVVCKYYPLICGLFIRCINWREQVLVFLKFALAWVVPIRSSSFDFLIIYSEYFLYIIQGMAQWIRHLLPSLIIWVHCMGPTWWKERIDFRDLPSGLAVWCVF